MAGVSFEYGTLVLEVGLVLTYSAVVFPSTYFLFFQVQTQAIGMSIGKAHRTVRCASPILKQAGDGDVEEIEMVREMRGDGDI